LEISTNIRNEGILAVRPILVRARFQPRCRPIGLVPVSKSKPARLEPRLEVYPKLLPWVVFALVHNVGIVDVEVEHDVVVDEK
jgi:hypothetical protein